MDIVTRGHRPTVDQRLIKLLDVDVQIILTWDADMTDMDLWITEPSGEQANYNNNRTQNRRNGVSRVYSGLRT